MEVKSVKNKVMSFVLIGILGLTGCGVNDSDYESKNGNPNDNSNALRGVVNKDNKNMEQLDDFGYSRIQEPLTNEQMLKNDTALVDRRKLAENISKIAVMTKNVEDVTTLVTDEEVFIVYKTNSQDRNEVADQVKGSALSIVPRFFHVYVSDNPDIRPLIDRYQGLDAETEHIEDSIEDVIKEFKKYPQGKKANVGENANGEDLGEMNQ
jgi:hypothetical protein